MVREFLSKHEKKVVGIAIVDSLVERTKLLDDWLTLLGDASYGYVVGLENNRVLTDEEWKQMKRDGEGNEVTVQAEEKCMKESTDKVNEKVRGK